MKKCEEEGVTEELLWVDHSLHSPSPCAAYGGGGRSVSKERLKLSLEKGWGEDIVLFFFIVSYYPNVL